MENPQDNLPQTITETKEQLKYLSEFLQSDLYKQFREYFRGEEKTGLSNAVNFRVITIGDFLTREQGLGALQMMSEFAEWFETRSAALQQHIKELETKLKTPITTEFE